MTTDLQMTLPLECDPDGDIRDAGGDAIATVRWPSPDEYDLMILRGNAISRAVNCHDKLRDACHAFLRAPSIGSSGPGSVTIEVTTFNLDAARAAVDEAMGADASITPMPVADALTRTLDALKAITLLAGNVPDDRIDAAGGQFDARQRGMWFVQARHIARMAILAVEAARAAKPA